MRRNGLLLLAICGVGALNVAIVGQDYLGYKLVQQPLRADGPNSPLAKSVRSLSARINSGQTRVAPPSDTSIVKAAVQFASNVFDERRNEAEARVMISRGMLRNTAIVWVIQLLLAAVIFEADCKAPNLPVKRFH